MKEKEENVGYYSVSSSTILYNKELKANEKLLCAIITSLNRRNFRLQKID